MAREGEETRARSALFDLANVSPLCVGRTSWLRGTLGEQDARDGAFPFLVSPTRAVYDPRSDDGVACRSQSAGCARTGDEERVKVVAVVKSMNGTVRAMAPRVTREDDADDGGAMTDSWEPEVEDGSAGLHEARVRRALEAESRGVDIGRALSAQNGLARDEPSREAVTIETTEKTEENVVNEEVVVSKSPESTSAAASPVKASDEDEFERAVAAALRAPLQPTTPIEKQPLDRAVPKRQFEPKLTMSSPEKYEPVAKPVSNAREALDFESKLELALLAAEAGGDLSAILSGPSTKTVRSPVGAESAESRINYRELGFTKAERKHHALHVVEE